MQYDTGATCRQGKLLILKSRAHSFHAADTSYMNLSLQEIAQCFRFSASQSHKLSRSTSFHVVKASVNWQCQKFTSQPF